MSIQGMVGLKLGMTRIFNDDGVFIPVTVIEVKPNRVTQVKNIERNGYCAIQVTAGDNIDISRINKPKIGHFVKSGVQIGRGLWEIRMEDSKGFAIGDIITVQIFQKVKNVDITGISKGKGFAGTVKRWNFSMQDASHGNSLSHRAPGSIGQNQTPGRVFKGKKMAGHLGSCKVTVQNLDVMQIDVQENLLFVKGAVPGTIGSNLIVRTSIK